jgi:uncharacterized membrane protein
MIETEKKWGTWVANILLILGVSFLLAGITFFFAFNWQNMLPLHKFTAIEIGICLFILGAIIYSTRTSVFAFYLMGASILVGVFLAVFGQIYQTGADTFQLFTIWAILILPWVFIAQFTPLWFIWLIIVNLALIFFLQNTSYFYAVLLIFNITVLLIKEHIHWLQGRMPRIAITLLLLVLAFQPIDHAISDFFLSYSVSIAIFILGILIYMYGFYLRDMWVVALTSIEIATLLCDLCMQILIRLEVSKVALYFSMLLFTFLIFTLTAYFLILLEKKQALKG